MTTILAADVVGYSRLMAADEAGTLAQIKTHRKELIEPKTAEYGGRVVKLVGDGTLMEFGCVVDAIHFAVDVQQAMADVAGVALWQSPWEPREEPALEANMAHPLPDKPSIAVLPFNNLSEDSSQEYFADGMTEDLITDLSNISGLFVIARNSSFSYKGHGAYRPHTVDYVMVTDTGPHAFSLSD